MIGNTFYYGATNQVAENLKPQKLRKNENTKSPNQWGRTNYKKLQNQAMELPYVHRCYKIYIDIYSKQRFYMRH